MQIYIQKNIFNIPTTTQLCAKAKIVKKSNKDNSSKKDKVSEVVKDSAIKDVKDNSSINENNAPTSESEIADQDALMKMIDMMQNQQDNNDVTKTYISQLAKEHGISNAATQVNSFEVDSKTISGGHIFKIDVSAINPEEASNKMYNPVKLDLDPLLDEANSLSNFINVSDPIKQDMKKNEKQIMIKIKSNQTKQILWQGSFETFNRLNKSEFNKLISSVKITSFDDKKVQYSNREIVTGVSEVISEISKVSINEASKSIEHNNRSANLYTVNIGYVQATNIENISQTDLTKLINCKLESIFKADKNESPEAVTYMQKTITSFALLDKADNVAISSQMSCLLGLLFGPKAEVQDSVQLRIFWQYISKIVSSLTQSTNLLTDLIQKEINGVYMILIPMQKLPNNAIVYFCISIDMFSPVKLSAETVHKIKTIDKCIQDLNVSNKITIEVQGDVSKEIIDAVHDDINTRIKLLESDLANQMINNSLFDNIRNHIKTSDDTLKQVLNYMKSQQNK